MSIELSCFQMQPAVGPFASLKMFFFMSTYIILFSFFNTNKLQFLPPQEKA